MPRCTHTHTRSSSVTAAVWHARVHAQTRAAVHGHARMCRARASDLHTIGTMHHRHHAPSAPCTIGTMQGRCAQRACVRARDNHRERCSSSAARSCGGRARTARGQDHRKLCHDAAKKLPFNSHHHRAGFVNNPRRFGMRPVRPAASAAATRCRSSTGFVNAPQER